MFKYPRTAHVEGSALQPGDKDLDRIPFSEIQGKVLIVEEKVDGANSGISFDGGKLVLQSRGHTLSGTDHPQFDLFKAWGFSMQNQLYAVLENRYIMFGEWMFAKHTVFYDDLPHYFLEFDVFDKQLLVFLNTQDRHSMFNGLDIVSVPVLHEGEIDSIDSLVALVQTSLFKTERMIDRLKSAAEKMKLDPEAVMSQTDLSMLGEGLYIKDETSGVVSGRYKWVRPDFLQTIKDSGSHWMGRRVLQNQLAEGVDIFG